MIILLFCPTIKNFVKVDFNILKYLNVMTVTRILNKNKGVKDL